MKLTKEDYMRLPKERLAELLAEMDDVKFDPIVTPAPPSGWGCDGTHCINPHHDCINCPVKYSSSGTITAPNTASGTSTATLNGNTSATDGKEHNPSFTD